MISCTALAYDVKIIIHSSECDDIVYLVDKNNENPIHLQHVNSNHFKLMISNQKKITLLEKKLFLMQSTFLNQNEENRLQQKCFEDLNFVEFKGNSEKSRYKDIYLFKLENKLPEYLDISHPKSILN